MATILKILIAVVLVVAIVGVLGLFLMYSIARSDGVQAVTLPDASYIQRNALRADYADAYRISMEWAAYNDIETVAANAFLKATEVYRDDGEVVYTGDAPGLRYYVSYVLDREARPRTLAVCTSVHYHNRIGRWYFFFVRPVHRMLVPYMLNRMAQSVPVAH